MLATSAAAVLLLRRQQPDQPQASPGQVEASNPLRLSTAIAFALAFAVVLMVVKVAETYFGRAGVYLAGILAGVADVNAITLSMARLSASGDLQAEVAAAAVLLAVLTNTVVKAIFALAFGSPRARRSIVLSFAPVVAVRGFGYPDGSVASANPGQ